MNGNELNPVRRHYIAMQYAGNKNDLRKYLEDHHLPYTKTNIDKVVVNVRDGEWIYLANGGHQWSSTKDIESAITIGLVISHITWISLKQKVYFKTIKRNKEMNCKQEQRIDELEKGKVKPIVVVIKNLLTKDYGIEKIKEELGDEYHVIPVLNQERCSGIQYNNEENNRSADGILGFDSVS